MKFSTSYLFAFVVLITSCVQKQTTERQIMTVRGVVNADSIGITLEHEHVTTDFKGAEVTPQPQYPVDKALNDLLPEFIALKQLGVKTIIECTPEYIGRDVLLLKALSEKTGINIITNTGYYAAVDKKYLPAHAFPETAQQLAARWASEWTDGINGTGIRPGFIKLGVGQNSLDSIEQKIVTAGALAHLQTGLKVAIHTGSGVAAFDEIDIFEAEGISLEALIVVHSQNASADDQVAIGRRGAWVSLDGVEGKDETIAKYAGFLLNLKQNNLLQKVLISHDDGWAVVNHGQDSITFDRFGERPEAPYSAIFEKLIPKLLESGFTLADIDQLLVHNPSEAFSIKICKK
ncbi:MAG: phosphotriesterase [Cyclobacteriaceae bacterium]|nr:phosphotriesterase [Cyclobacteriaceae bacterium]